eukprot:5968368-Alexandrium_andersonii.AAC.1
MAKQCPRKLAERKSEFVSASSEDAYRQGVRTSRTVISESMQYLPRSTRTNDKKILLLHLGSRELAELVHCPGRKGPLLHE